ncbi:MAG: hypothetical protein HRU07_07785 [Nitrosopumilus sp.]|nr:hypothetical protein [Nitrosopumilus sp.]NRA06038.1 hypothetical protein [Nitrosopumilus sp.]
MIYNKSKIIKTILFASLIAVMVLSFSSMDYAEADGKRQGEVYDGKEVKDAFVNLDPYMTVAEDKKIYLNEKAAMEDGISKRDIKLGLEYIELQNTMMRKIQAGTATYATLDKEKAKKFEKFFSIVKEGEDDPFEKSIFPVAYGAWCNVWGPHYQPNPVSKTATFTPISNYLVYRDYHQVQEPWTFNSEIDYAKKIVAYGCDNGVFREQAIIRSTVGYSVYNPEPNPEITTYMWPTWWWGPYVYSWHR